MAEASAGIGPKVATDALGRKYWRFDSAEALRATGSALTSRACTVFAIMRAHAVRTTNQVFSVGGTMTTPMLEASSQGAAVSMPRCSNRAITAATPNAANMLIGSQLQLVGAATRTTANGAMRYYVNTQTADSTQSGTLTSGTAWEIGRNSASPGASGTWGIFDLYELVVYSGELTNAQADSVAAALVAHYAIPQPTKQFVVEGDSISAIIGIVDRSASPAMWLTNPGAGPLSDGTWRVVNAAVSGSTAATIAARRDEATSWANLKLPDRNVVIIEGGTNDLGSGGLTLTQTRDAYVSLYNTATTGILQRGWEVRHCCNIAQGGGGQPDREALRLLWRNPAFLTDTLTGAGQAFDGKMTIISTDLIEDNGNTVFLTQADAQDTTYYLVDGTHVTAEGSRMRALGGSTPQYGAAFGL